MTFILQNKVFRFFFVLCFWVGLWYILALTIGRDLILPTPLAVIKAFVELASTKAFYLSALATLARILIGFLLAVIVAIFLVAVTCTSNFFSSLISPIIKVIRSSPVASFIILALLWLGKSLVPVLISFLIVVPIVWENLTSAYTTIDANLIELSKAYRLSRKKVLKVLYLPSLLPSFKAACLTSMGLAWKSGVAAEVLAQPRFALGTNLYYSKVYLETANLFAHTALIVVLSIIIERIIKKLLTE